MPRASPRQTIHSSNLIRILSDLTLVDTCYPGHAFAEELGQWLNLDDAITLHALHASGASVSVTRSGPTEKAPLAEQFARLRAGLVPLELPADATHRSGNRVDKPPGDGGLQMAAAASYEPYRRAYSAHQRDMEAKIRPFRLQVREVLARTSPTLAKLAALDAVFDKSIFERERQLLSMLPALMAKRFEVLRQTHHQSFDVTPDPVDSDSSFKSVAWLTRFRQELQAVLLAELETRLEPTFGLIEAYNLEISQLS